MSAADGINTGIKEELTPWDLDCGGENAFVSSQSSSENLRDSSSLKPGEMGYQPTYHDQSLDCDPPILATAIPYPDSPLRGPKGLPRELGFEEMLIGANFPENYGPYAELEGLLFGPNPISPPHASYSSETADAHLEVPPVTAPADSIDNQIVKKEPNVSPAPTEDRPHEALDHQNAENLSSVIPTPQADESIGGHTELVHASYDAVAKPPTTPEPSSKNVNGTYKPQAYGYSKAEKVPMPAPINPGKFDGSAEFGRIGDEGPSEQSMGALPILYYSSSKEAEAALRAHLNSEAPSDNTAPQTDREKALLVGRLFQAMTDMSGVPQVGPGFKKPQAIKSFEEKKYSDRHIQIVCWRVLEQCISRQRMGPIVPPWQRTRKPKDYENFKQRFDATLEALRCEKQLCKRLMAPYLIDDFVDDPTCYVKRIQQNKTLNDKKKDQIKLGRAAQAASSSVSQDISSAAKTRKRKTTDTAQAQPSSKRTRRTKPIKAEPGNSHSSENMAGPSQRPLQFYSFPLDPMLATQGHDRDRDWAELVNFEASVASEIEKEIGSSSSSAFSSASGHLAGCPPVTNEQTLIDAYGEVFGPPGLHQT
ncbi:MAG: hypothetical protein M1840_003137 [Geoglossum simile]|nr:MAG: hypothetical protein M1840_003137 [Geoglossum simile]